MSKSIFAILSVVAMGGMQHAPAAPAIYRLEVDVRMALDGSGAIRPLEGGGASLTGVATQVVTAAAFLSVTSRDSAGGRVVGVTVDSGGGPSIPPSRFPKHISVFVKGDQGNLLLSPEPTDLLGSMVVSGLPLLMAGDVRPSARATWTDSLVVDSAMFRRHGASGAGRTVGRWRTVAKDSLAGRIDAATSVTQRVTDGEDSGTVVVRNSSSGEAWLTTNQLGLLTGETLMNGETRTEMEDIGVMVSKGQTKVRLLRVR